VKHAAWNAWPHRAVRAYRPGTYESRHIQHSSVGSGQSCVTRLRRATSSDFRLCLLATLKINMAQKNTVLVDPGSILFFLPVLLGGPFFPFPLLFGRFYFGPVSPSFFVFFVASF
jgi:hypothetical protein